jgi:hypothetical protein
VRSDVSERRIPTFSHCKAFATLSRTSHDALRSIPIFHNGLRFYRVSYKSGTVGIVGILTHLLQNMFVMSLHTDAISNKFLPVQRNGVNCLWCDLTACSNNSILKMLEIAYFHSTYLYFQMISQVKV